MIEVSLGLASNGQSLDLSIFTSMALILYCFRLDAYFSIFLSRNSMRRYKSSPEEVAASCDVTFAMLADPDSAVSTYFGGYHFLLISLISNYRTSFSGGSCMRKSWSCRWYEPWKRVCFACSPSRKDLLDNFFRISFFLHQRSLI